MVAFFITSGIVILFIIVLKIWNAVEQRDNTISELERINGELISDGKKLIEKINRTNEKLRSFHDALLSEINSSLTSKAQAFKWLAGMIADYMIIAENKYQEELEYSRSTEKHNRAIKINELKAEKRALIEKNKWLQYQLAEIYAMLPEAEQLGDFDETEDQAETEIFIEDSYKWYLSPEEYERLSDTEKNRRALEYCKRRKKTKRELGRDYELYVGYSLEQLGYTVEYFGIEKKFNDLGRDLIAQNKDFVLVVQCKNWAKHKVIHEKHIAQLYGTLAVYYLEHPEEKRKIMGYFVTSTVLSDEAKRFAKELNIAILENQKLGDYPMIKCNVGRDEFGFETRIYHLPIDQQYDRVKIEPKKGEFMALTIEEAEAKGFRRAWKWKPE